MSKLSYNREEAAQEVGISVDKLDQERRAGRICARYVGSKPIYEHSELKRWLEALPSEPPTRL